MSKKIVLDAGHGLNTAGKRCLRSIDPNETREWTLNNRIVSKVQNKLAAYDVSVLRVDDPTGKSDIALEERVKKANNFKADIYCSFHHNAGINGGAGGGITVITYDNRDTLKDIRTLLYNKLLVAGGLEGNRAEPLQARSDLYVLRATSMSAVLVEHGFMDSTIDTPEILKDEYAEKMANGWIAFFESYLGIKKKAAATVTAKPTTTTSQAATSAYYPKYYGSSTSLDTILKAIGVPAKYYGSWSKRKPLAKANGISLYVGTASQNTKLKNLAKEGKLKKV